MSGRARAPPQARQRCVGCRRPAENRPSTGVRPGANTAAFDNSLPLPLLSNQPATATPLAWLVRNPGCRPKALLKPSRKTRGVNRGGTDPVVRGQQRSQRRQPGRLPPRRHRAGDRAARDALCPSVPGSRTVRSWIGSPDCSSATAFHCLPRPLLGIGSIAAHWNMLFGKTRSKPTHAPGHGDTMSRGDDHDQQVDNASLVGPIGASIICAALTASRPQRICAANATGSESQVTYQLSGSAPVADYISYETSSGPNAAGPRAVAMEDAVQRHRQQGARHQRARPRLDHVHDPGRRQGGQPSDGERGACPHRVLALTFRPAPAIRNRRQPVCVVSAADRPRVRCSPTANR